MGSHTFENVDYTDASVRDAYDDLCDAKRHEYGSSGYNGTISTTNGVAAVNVAPMTLDEARALSNTRIQTLSKGEVCEAIPLVAETRAEYERLGTKQATVTVSGAVFADRDALIKAVAKELGVPTATIDTCRVAFDSTARRSRISATSKVTAVAPKEKTETRFFIIKADNQKMPAWETGFPTQAEARANLDTLLRFEFGSIATVDAEIISMTRRVSGEPLVKATVEPKTVTVTLDVNLHRLTQKATRGTVRKGWYFYGWARS